MSAKSAEATLGRLRAFQGQGRGSGNRALAGSAVVISPFAFAVSTTVGPRLAMPAAMIIAAFALPAGERGIAAFVVAAPMVAAVIVTPLALTAS